MGIPWNSAFQDMYRAEAVCLYVFRHLFTLNTSDERRFHLRACDQHISDIGDFDVQHDEAVMNIDISLRIIGPSYGGFGPCIAGVWTLKTFTFEGP